MHTHATVSGTKRARTRAGRQAAAGLARDLAQMLDAGLPIARAAAVLGRQADDAPIRGALIAVTDAMDNGSAFSDALAAHEGLVGSHLIRIVRAGERNGALPDALRIAAEHIEAERALARRIWAVGIYSGSMLAIAIIVVGWLSYLYIHAVAGSASSVTAALLGTIVALAGIACLGLISIYETDQEIRSAAVARSLSALLRAGELMAPDELTAHAEGGSAFLREALALGIETGTAGEMLRHAADYHESAMARQAGGIRTALQAIVFVAIGAGVGIAIISAFSLQ